MRDKLNTRRSIESDLVGFEDFVPIVLWSNYFYESLLYMVDTDIFQDNQSYMLLYKNGTISIVKRSRHINIIY